MASSVIGGHARRGRSPLRSFAGRSHCTWDTEPVRTRLPAVVTRAVRNSHRDVVAPLATEVLDARPVDDDRGDHRSHEFPFKTFAHFGVERVGPSLFGTEPAHSGPGSIRVPSPPE